MIHHTPGYAAQHPAAQPHAPLIYTLRIPEPDKQYADITLEIPSDGRTLIELMMPIWSPGFYRVEAYAEQVHILTAYTAEGTLLPFERPTSNRWRIHLPDGVSTIRVTYRLRCNSATVTTNWIDADFAVLNGPATFITVADSLDRQHELVLQFPAQWSHAYIGLPTKPEAPCNHYVANDFDTLVDAPIIIGTPTVRTFVVDGRRHDLVAVGDQINWDGERMARDLEQVVRENERLWQTLPYPYYVFLLVFREGGGGLEHGNSTLVTAQPSRMLTPNGYDALLSLISHEFFHAFNVKRLRPHELGPFDYEHPPRTLSLWVAEGLTCYYTDLLLCRAGLRKPEWLLARLSEQIAVLQAAPGRLVQTLEQSSYDVWDNSFSGLNPTDTSVSYYIKGYLVGWLLDAHIRQGTDDAASVDDVMRLAYTRYSGAYGFTPEQFRAVVAEIGGSSVAIWINQAVASTAELDYTAAVAWYGLQFAPAHGEQAGPTWQLQINETASQERLRSLLTR